MNGIKEAIASSRKIVIKIGSNTLARANGSPNLEFMRRFARECKSLVDKGKQIVLVSSGAQVNGLATIHNWARKRDVHYRQALSAIGQVELMYQWRESFAQVGLHIGQILLTKEDFSNEHCTLNIRNTLFTLVDEGVVPIINENDSVSFDEIRIGDNDNLASLSAILWSADLLILLSDIDGVYTDDPKAPDAVFIERVTDINALRRRIHIGTTNEFGTGGIVTKIEAAQKTMAYGIPMVLANGSKENIISSLESGEAQGTLFMEDNASGVNSGQ